MIHTIDVSILCFHNIIRLSLMYNFVAYYYRLIKLIPLQAPDLITENPHTVIGKVIIREPSVVDRGLI